MHRLVVIALLLPTAAEAATWEPLAAELLQTEKPGYGGLSGIVVDRQTGDVYAWLSDRGLYRSTNQGKSFQKLGKRITGRTEQPGCMLTNPVGPVKRWLIATVYGGPVLTSSDGGGTWTPMDKKASHVDWAAANNGEPGGSFVLALKHESGGLLLASTDGGKSFHERGKGFGPACVFDDQTAVVVRNLPAEGKRTPRRVLARTTDAGKTFTQIADFGSRTLPVWYGKTPYWLVDGGIVTSADQGKSWERMAKLEGGMFGPVFGKNKNHLFVLTQAGVKESTDGGKSWLPFLLPPRELKGISPLTWLGYDARNDTLYLMKMGSLLYRMKR